MISCWLTNPGYIKIKYVFNFKGKAQKGKVHIMAFSFDQYNTEKLFTFDVNVINEAHPRKKWKDPNVDERYTNLKALYEKYGAGKKFRFRGCYINKKSTKVKEAPVIALDTIYVNLPQHQLDNIKQMMQDPEEVNEINAGRAGFRIAPYRYDVNGTGNEEEYYKPVWCNYRPGFDDDEDGTDEDFV